MSDRYAWMSDALCAQTDPDLFHADSGNTAYRDAKKICARCPVAQQCDTHAQAVEADTAHTWRHGIWAGHTPRTRAGRGDAKRRAQIGEAA